MIRELLCMAAGAVLLAGCVCVQTSEHGSKCKSAIMCKAQPIEEPNQVLRHVVLLKFKDGTTAEQIKRIEDAFCALPGKIDAIGGFEWGTDVSIENRQQGFTHCCMFTFLSEADRDVYLPHPAHEELVALSRPYLDKLLVVDYWAKS